MVELAQWGYPPAEAAAALGECGGHVEAALAALHARLAAAAGGAAAGSGDGAAAAAAVAAAAGGSELEEWQEERTALEAIYGEEACFPSDRHTTMSLPIELTSAAASAAAGGQHELRLLLDFFAPLPASDGASATAAAPYPHRPPVVGARCEGVPPRALLTLTHQLTQQAAEVAGHPMLYELASAAAERFERCLLSPLPLARLLPPAGGPSRAASDADLAAAAEEQLRLEDIVNSVVPRAPRRQRDGAASGRAGGAEVAAESRRLQQRQRELGSSAEHAAMRGVRSRLPAAAQRAEVLALCGSRRVVVVSGATGCGKSTQVRSRSDARGRDAEHTEVSLAAGALAPGNVLSCHVLRSSVHAAPSPSSSPPCRRCLSSFWRRPSSGGTAAPATSSSPRQDCWGDSTLALPALPTHTGQPASQPASPPDRLPPNASSPTPSPPPAAPPHFRGGPGGARGGGARRACGGHCGLLCAPGQQAVGAHSPAVLHHRRGGAGRGGGAPAAPVK